MRKIGLALSALVALTWSLPAFAQSVPLKVLSTASTNSHLVFAGANGASLRTLVASNSTATAYFLKLYNKATAPTCGTDTPVQTIALQGDQTVSVDLGPAGQSYSAGLGMCLTGAIADNDTTSAAAGVAINFGVSGR